MRGVLLTPEHRWECPNCTATHTTREQVQVDGSGRPVMAVVTTTIVWNANGVFRITV